jgi:hypothetical protein
MIHFIHSIVLQLALSEQTYTYTHIKQENCWDIFSGLPHSNPIFGVLTSTYNKICNGIDKNKEIIENRNDTIRY